MELFESRGKHEKAEVRYTDYSHSDVKRCSECANFYYPSSCVLVKGEISPDGLCDLFTFSVDKKAEAVLRGFADGIKLKV